MPNPRSRSLAALLLLAVCAGPATAGEPSRTEPLRGWAEIDSEGRLVAIEWHPSVPAALHTVALDGLRKLSFSPALHEGQPQASRSWLTGDIELHADGDDYEVLLREIAAGPRFIKLEPPRYPVTALRRRAAAAVIAEFVVGVDGHARDVRARTLDGDQAFADAVRDALAKWRFEPEQVDGQPVASAVCVPFTFAIERKFPTTRPTADDCEALPATGPRAPGQTRLWQLVEVTGSRPL
jgi:TonB family protein